MITQGLVGICSAFLHHKVVEIRTQAVLLIGSLCSIMKGREFLEETSYIGFKKMIFDEFLKAREACTWALCRILTGRDGVDSMAKNGIVEEMINSFMKYTESPCIDEAVYIIRLLEAFVNIL